MSILHLRSSIAGLTVALLSTATPARADVAEECVKASDAGQLKRDAGALLSAREELLVCSRDACPSIVRKDCLAWLSELDPRIPSVVLGAKDSAGNDLSDVAVSIDGRPLASRLGASATPIDPGEHVFRFDWKEGPSTEARIIAREGERQRPVLVVLERRALTREAPVAPARRTVPVASWVLGGVALAGLGGFTYFYASGLSDRSDLEGSCAPRCTDDDVDPARRKIVIADLSLGIAAVAAVAAVVTYLLHEPAR